MTNVIPFNGITKLEIPVDTVLDSAKTKLDSVVLCGFDNDGELYFASTCADGGEVIWLLEQAKLALLMGDRDE